MTRRGATVGLRSVSVLIGTVERECILACCLLKPTDGGAQLIHQFQTFRNLASGMTVLTDDQGNPMLQSAQSVGIPIECSDRTQGGTGSPGIKMP